MFSDIRNITYLSRLEIGMDSIRRKWSTAKAQFGSHSLKILSHPVMEDWEQPYMKELARIATSRLGTVLEVGFGMGIAASYIQQKNIDHHIIIEANNEVYNKALEFKKQAKHRTTVLKGFWEDTIDTIPSGSIDGILFDTYPLSEKEIHKNHYTFFPHAYRLLNEGGIFTYYSDEINSFSPEHRIALQNAGFRYYIKGVVVKVKPPKSCQYWKSGTILAPIIIK